MQISYFNWFLGRVKVIINLDGLENKTNKTKTTHTESMYSNGLQKELIFYFNFSSFNPYSAIWITEEEPQPTVYCVNSESSYRFKATVCCLHLECTVVCLYGWYLMFDSISEHIHISHCIYIYNQQKSFNVNLFYSIWFVDKELWIKGHNGNIDIGIIDCKYIFSL